MPGWLCVSEWTCPGVSMIVYNFGMTRNNERWSREAHAALAHVGRTEILNYLKGKDYVRAGQIAADLGMANSTLSGHLKVMQHAGLVVSRQVGTEVQYRANLSTVEDLIISLQSFLRR